MQLEESTFHVTQHQSKSMLFNRYLVPQGIQAPNSDT